MKLDEYPKEHQFACECGRLENKEGAAVEGMCLICAIKIKLFEDYQEGILLNED